MGLVAAVGILRLQVPGRLLPQGSPRAAVSSAGLLPQRLLSQGPAATALLLAELPGHLLREMSAGLSEELRALVSLWAANVCEVRRSDGEAAS